MPVAATAAVAARAVFAGGEGVKGASPRKR